MVYQLTQDDVDRSSTLEPCDVGLWVYVVTGTLQGFCATRLEAEAACHALSSKEHYDDARDL
jgi:hypothetical protein